MAIMTTQPQSPSEQEIADLISGKTGDPYFDSDARLIDEVGLRVAILKVMAQAADKREQTPQQHFEAWWTDYCRDKAHVMTEVPVSEYYAQLRQGRAAEGEGKQ